MLAEVKNSLLEDLGLESYSSSALDSIVEGNSRYLKDLRMNLSGFKRSKVLSVKEQTLLAIAIACNNNNDVLQDVFAEKSKAEGATAEEIAEVVSCASLMTANNVLYRFRHHLNKESYNKMPAGLRMQIMMKPILGKEFFELLSTAISAVNGCSLCVESHEASLLKLGTSEKRIFEAIRYAAVITSLGKVIY